MWHDASTPHATYSATLELDLADIKPSLAGPKRPQDRVLLEKVKDNFHANLEGLTATARRRRPKSCAWTPKAATSRRPTTSPPSRSRRSASTTRIAT
jgi:aconitase A